MSNLVITMRDLIANIRRHVTLGMPPFLSVVELWANELDALLDALLARVEPQLVEAERVEALDAREVYEANRGQVSTITSNPGDGSTFNSLHYLEVAAARVEPQEEPLPVRFSTETVPSYHPAEPSGAPRWLAEHARIEPPPQELYDALQPLLRRWLDDPNTSSYLWTLVAEYEPELPGSSRRREMLEAVKRLEVLAPAPPTQEPKE